MFACDATALRSRPTDKRWSNAPYLARHHRQSRSISDDPDGNPTPFSLMGTSACNQLTAPGYAVKRKMAITWSIFTHCLSSSLQELAPLTLPTDWLPLGIAQPPP